MKGIYDDNIIKTAIKRQKFLKMEIMKLKSPVSLMKNSLERLNRFELAKIIIKIMNFF